MKFLESTGKTTLVRKLYLSQKIIFKAMQNFDSCQRNIMKTFLRVYYSLVKVFQ